MERAEPLSKNDSDVLAAGRRRPSHTYGSPPLPDSIVPRPRVADLLAERIAKQQLVQVVAPAGAGKTTAVAQATQALDRALIWLTLQEWHRSPGVLMKDLVEAVELVAPGLSRLGVSADMTQLELAAAAGTFAHRQHALLVLDDCHLVKDSREASTLIAALVRRSAPGLHVVLVGRAALRLEGLGLDAVAPEATVGDEVLCATPEEAAEILRAHGSSVEVDEAVEATGGWVAGLVFETWRARGDGTGSEDPLRNYLEREVLPRLEAQAAESLVAASVFERVDASCAQALGIDDPRAWFVALREAGLPAVWPAGGTGMCLHPRIRELLREELETGSRERRQAALQAAASTYKHEGELERALDLFLEVGDTAAAGRLLPEVIVEVVERQDIALAERYLAAVPLDPEPARVVLARLSLASLQLERKAGLVVIDRLDAEGRLDQVVTEEPAIGALACFFLAGVGEFDRALDLHGRVPQGREANVARLLLSAVRDDPRAPVPAFQGDALDAILARALYHRGLLQELRVGRTSWSESTGVHDFDTPASDDGQGAPKRFTTTLARFARAISDRNLEDARRYVRALEAVPFYELLAEVELAIRLERDPGHARAALEALSEDRVSTAVFYTELLGAWDGGVRLLEDDPAGAAHVLRETATSMRRGDRILMLPSALVYLAEAEWRLGNEEASDRATDEAYAVARRQGSLHDLLLALADFPGVLSRRLDAEADVQSPWPALGRALVTDLRAAGALVVSPAAVHLREFGEPALLVDGRDVRPKIRKSLELLCYLLLSPAPQVSREDVLTALWNGRDDDSTRAYLRQALRHLREVLPEGVAVEARGDALVLEGALTSESLELEALLAEAARDPGPGRLGYLLEALELDGRGLFLEGSSDVTWIDDRRAQIASILSDARLDAAELLLEADRHLRALALVDEALDNDPLSERAWRIRMRTLGLLCDYDGVTAAYAACTSALAEIGLEPSATTSELARSLRR